MRAWSLIMPYLCSAKARPLWHDYANELIHKRILFVTDFQFTNKKSPRISCAGFSWLCCKNAADRF
jgi:hypothetical protein